MQTSRNWRLRPKLSTSRSKPRGLDLRGHNWLASRQLNTKATASMTPTLIYGTIIDMFCVLVHMPATTTTHIFIIISI